MAAPCPTSRPTAYPFEPTFCPTTMPAGYSTFPTPYGFEFPANKTYSSVFNRETPCPPTAFPVERTFPNAPFPTNFNGWPVERTFFPSTWSNTPFWNTPFNNTWYPTPYERCPSTWSSSWPVAERRFFNNTFPSTWLNNEWSTPYFNNNNTNTPFNYFNKPTWSNNWWSNNVDTLSRINFRPSNPIEFYCLTNPIRVLDREGNRDLWLCFDLRGYKPEEINVTLNKAERCIVVEATHEVKEGKEHHVLRKFYRKFCFPETLAKVDLSKCELRSCFTSEGLLNVECTLPKMTTEEIAKCPITSRYFTCPPTTNNTFVSCYPNTTPVNCKVN